MFVAFEDGTKMSRRPAKSATDRRWFLQTAVTAGAAAVFYPALGAGREIISASVPQSADVKPFELDEITIPELQNGMKSGNLPRELSPRNISRASMRSTSAARR